MISKWFTFLFFEEWEVLWRIQARLQERGWEIKCWDKKEFENAMGTVESKAITLAKYKFCICYENMRDVKGYITEKIFDCFMAGCVPIYWGASNITDYIPADCFIDRRTFTSMEELYVFMKGTRLSKSSWTSLFISMESLQKVLKASRQLEVEGHMSS